MRTIGRVLLALTAGLVLGFVLIELGLLMQAGPMAFLFGIVGLILGAVWGLRQFQPKAISHTAQQSHEQ